MSKPKHNAPNPVETAENRLDEALEETFPASDPIAVDSIEPPHASRPRHSPRPLHSPAKAKPHG